MAGVLLAHRRSRPISNMLARNAVLMRSVRRNQSEQQPGPRSEAYAVAWVNQGSVMRQSAIMPEKCRNAENGASRQINGASRIAINQAVCALAAACALSC